MYVCRFGDFCLFGKQQTVRELVEVLTPLGQRSFNMLLNDMRLEGNGVWHW